jgi:hypothetical protein
LRRGSFGINESPGLLFPSLSLSVFWFFCAFRISGSRANGQAIDQASERASERSIERGERASDRSSEAIHPSIELPCPSFRASRSPPSASSTVSSVRPPQTLHFSILSSSRTVPLFLPAFDSHLVLCFCVLFCVVLFCFAAILLFYARAVCPAVTSCSDEDTEAVEAYSEILVRIARVNMLPL